MLWLVLLIYGAAMWLIAPLASAARGFFAGAGGPSAAFVGASLLFTGLVLMYALKGGLRASLVTDVVQFVLLVGGVGATLVWLAPRLRGLPLAPPRPGVWNSGLDF